MAAGALDADGVVVGGWSLVVGSERNRLGLDESLLARYSAFCGWCVSGPVRVSSENHSDAGICWVQCDSDGSAPYSERVLAKKIRISDHCSLPSSV